MTLEDYLYMREHQVTYVLVDPCDGGPPRPERHPIPKDELPALRGIWEKTYYDWQQLKAQREKLVEVARVSKQKLAQAKRKSA